MQLRQDCIHHLDMVRRTSVICNLGDTRDTSSDIETPRNLVESYILCSLQLQQHSDPGMDPSDILTVLQCYIALC